MDRWFANPALLGLAIAAVLPWLWYWMRRPRYLTHDWAANRILQAAVERTAMRRRWRSWFLLALQTAAVLGLTVALASPQAPLATLPTAQPRTSSTWRILVLDDSLSMRYQEQGQSRFAQAKAWAQQRLDEATLGDAWSLVSLAHPQPWILEGPSYDLSQVTEVLDQWTAGYGPADCVDVLSQLERGIRNETAQALRFDRIELVIATNLEAQNWQQLEGQEAREILGRLRDQVNAQMVVVGDCTSNNISLGTVQGVPTLAPEQIPTPVWVEVTNHDTQQSREVPVRFTIDGRFQQEVTVRLEPQATRRVTFSLEVSGSGEHLLEWQIPDDALDADNRRWSKTRVPETLEVILWTQPQAEQQALRDVFGALAQRGRKMRVREGTARDLQNLPPQESVLIIGDLPPGPGRTAADLRAFVESGGTAFLFLGPQSRPWLWWEAWDAATRDEDAWQITANDPLRVEVTSSDPPALRVFQGGSRELLERVPVWRQWTKTRDLPSENVWLRTEAGGPLLWSQPQGQGRLVVWMSALTPASLDATGEAWSALSIWPVFPVLISRWLDTQVGSSQTLDELEIRAGQITLEQAGMAGGWSRFTEPESDSTTTVAPLDWLRPGAYRRRDDPRGSWRVVNVQASRSRGEPLDRDDLPTWLQKSADTEPVSPASSKRDAGQGHVYQALLAAVLVLLLVEVWWINRRPTLSNRSRRLMDGRRT